MIENNSAQFDKSILESRAKRLATYRKDKPERGMSNGDFIMFVNTMANLAGRDLDYDRDTKGRILQSNPLVDPDSGVVTVFSQSPFDDKRYAASIDIAMGSWVGAPLETLYFTSETVDNNKLEMPNKYVSSALGEDVWRRTDVQVWRQSDREARVKIDDAVNDILTRQPDYEKPKYDDYGYIRFSFLDDLLPETFDPLNKSTEIYIPTPETLQTICERVYTVYENVETSKKQFAEFLKDRNKPKSTIIDVAIEEPKALPENGNK